MLFPKSLFLGVGEKPEPGFPEPPASVTSGNSTPGDVAWYTPVMSVAAQARGSPRSGLLALFAAVGFALFVTAYRIADYPIYFFCDEAISANWAEHLLRHGGRGEGDVLLPTFFTNGHRKNVGSTVYLLVPLVAVFGKSVKATRALSAVLAAAASGLLGLACAKTLGSRWGWLLPLFLVANPVWFLHARTGFDVPVAAAFYGAYLAAALFFLAGQGSWLVPGLVCAALAFYAYAPARLVVPASLAALALVWLATGRKPAVPWSKVLPACALLAAPYLRFLLLEPREQFAQLRLLGSPWAAAGSVGEAFLQSVRNYLGAWSFSFWFEPRGEAAVRHVVLDLPLLAPATALFAAFGVLASLTWGRLPNSVRWTLLSHLATSQASAFLMEAGITRQLFFVPVAATLAVVGGSWLAERGGGVLRRLLSVGLAVVLGAYGVVMLVRALALGPTWHRDYGLYGMQWGAAEVFAEVNRVLETNQEAEVAVSPTWSNGAETLALFFLGEPQRVVFRTPDWYAMRLRESPARLLHVLTPPEYAFVVSSPKFTKPQLHTVLYCPDGTPCFYVCRFDYSPQAAEIIGQEVRERAKPVEARLTIGGERVVVRHSRLDMGEVGMVFDGDPESLIRTLEANPLRLELVFPTVHRFLRLEARIGAGPAALRAWAREAAEAPWRACGLATFQAAPDTRAVSVSLCGAASRFWAIEVENAGEGEPSNVHLWELALREEAEQREEQGP